MAVIASENASTLKIKFDCGMDFEGNNIKRTTSYNNLKHDASNEDIMEVANAIVAL